MNCIVIAVSGLRARDLGCYGGPWVDTAASDRFAADSFTFDLCFAYHADPKSVRQQWWSGRYALVPSQPESNRAASPDSSLVRSIRDAGIQTVLIRDSNAIAPPPNSPHDFERLIEIDRTDGQSAEQVFHAAQKWLKRRTKVHPFLLFLDLHGAHPPWQPTEMPEAAPEPESTDPDAEPDIDSTPHGNPESEHDETTSLELPDPVRQLHSAVVAELDAALGTFLEFLRDGKLWDQTLIIVTSDLGALDANAGDRDDERFDEERLHVPLLVRLPGAHDPSSRSAALVQSVDLLPTVCDALGVAVPDVDGRSLLPIVRLETPCVRDCARMVGTGRSQVMRTTEWLFERGTEGEADTIYIRLFIKPDDRLGRNDVAKQFPDVVDRFERLLSGDAGRS